MATIDSTEVSVRLTLNKASVQSLDRQIKTVVTAIAKRHPVALKLKLDQSGNSKLRAEVQAAAAKVGKTQSIRLKTQYSGEGYQATLAGVKAAAARMSRSTSVRLKTDVDTRGATSGIRRIDREVKSLGRNRSITSGLSGVMSSLTAPLSQFSQTALRLPFTALRALITSALALSPALVTLASSAGMASASLIALGPAAIGAAGALGAVVGAFFGVSQALKAAGTLDDQVVQSNSKNAATRLKNAKAIVSAQRSIEAAERQVANAQKGARSAQEDINRARLEAKRDLEDLSELVSGFGLDEEGARLAVERAALRLTETNSDVKASFLDRREAAYDLRVAEERLNKLRRDHVYNVRNLAVAEKKGVEGSDRVVAAKQAYKEALENVKNAQEGVRDAQESLNTTLDQQAESLKTVNPAAAKLADLLSKMSPAGREMFYLIRSLKDESQGWRREIESKTLPGFISFLKAVTKRGRSGVSTLDLMAKKTALLGASLGTTVKQLGKYAASPAFKRDFSRIMDNNRLAFDAIGRAVNNLVPPLTRLFANASPLLVRFGGYLEKITARFANWINSFSDAELTSFFKRSGDELAKWWSIAVNIGRTLMGILRAAFPSGSDLASKLVQLSDALADFVNSEEGQKKLQEFFRKFNEFIKNFDYQKFWQMVKGIFYLTLALKALSAAGAVANSVGALGGSLGGLATASRLLANPLGAVVLIVGAAAAAFAALIYFGNKNSDAFRGKFKGAMEEFSNLMNNHVKPAFEGIKNSLRELGSALAKAGLDWEFVGTVVASSIVNFGRFLALVARMVQGAAWAFTGVAKLLTGFFATWINGIKKLWGGLGKGWDNLWDGAGKKIESIKKTILSSVRGLMSGMSKAVMSGVSAITSAFDGLRKAAATPVNFIIDKVYNNGLKKLFNGAAMSLGMKTKMPDVSPVSTSEKTTSKATWHEFNSGGIAPGSGNQDTVPAMLTPGEGILTKSEMKKLGGKRGFEALRERIQYFKTGGIVQGGPAGLITSGALKGLSALTGKTPGSGMLRDIAVTAMKKLIAAMPSGLMGAVTSGLNGIVNSGGSGQAGGYRAMYQWIKSQVPGTRLTSGYRPGDPGYHGSGRAADLTFSDGSERTGGGKALTAFNAIKSTFMKSIKELIWDFAGGKAVWNGQNHFFTGSGAGPGTHDDHIHWAMDNGGPFQDGQTVKNYSGRPEMVLTNPQAHALEERLRGGEPIHIKVYIGDQEIKDIVRVEVDNSEKKTAHILAKGRRS